MQLGQLTSTSGAAGASGAGGAPGAGNASSNAARSAVMTKIAIVHLPHIANFDDFDPLRQEPEVQLVLVEPHEPLPLDAQLVIIPGSKTTIADLDHLRERGWHHELHAYLKRGGRVLGLCAGYQMLGNVVSDPLGIEGSRRATAGLGLLDLQTTMGAHKTLRRISGTELTTGARIEGYEMHIGLSTGRATAHPMMRFDDGSVDGAIADRGRIAGCHVHGLFHSAPYRTALLASLGARSIGADHAASVDAALDEVAQQLERSLRIENLLSIGERAG
jgi:adenosylcobyric acid synthase